MAEDDAEPDYRMSLAAERTYLAYIRTSLALLVAGVAVVGAFQEAGYLGLRRLIGVVLVLLGLLVGGFARARWREVDRAMRLNEPLPRGRTEVPIAIGVVIAGLLCLVLVVFL
ncbi:MAG TPA: DUF202 domain-containing protein [Candidatus Limnocylindria bacterium]|nr:DUF202 domain-containing protein [Candidatus Limnocylindria bacterium]